MKNVLKLVFILTNTAQFLGLARFAFMHCIGSSLCFWVNTIIDETMDSLVEKLTKDEDYCHDPLEYVYYNEFDGKY